MEKVDNSVLVVNPTNSIPKGFGAVLMWGMLGLSIALIPFGIGLLIIWAPIVSLFVIPRKYKKDMPVSCVLDREKICVYNIRSRKKSWAVNWEDIDSIYLISTHWSTPKNIGLRLNSYDSLRASVEENSQPGTLSGTLNRFFSNKAGLMLSRMVTKCETMIYYQALDRPPQAFAELLHSYMYQRQLDMIGTKYSTAKE